MSTPLDATEKYRGALGTQAWDQLSAQVDALTAAWQGPDLPPDLARFVPAEPKALRRLLLVELIKVDLEQRWLHFGLPKKVEEYVEEFPEIRDNAGFVPCDLIYEEFHIRSRSDEPAASQEFLQRFPDQADQLKRLFDIQTNRTSSTVISGRRCPEIEIGQQIDDFDLLVRLGKGAFASVYLARQRSMQRLVALKVSNDRGDEPQTLAQLDHPHIVRVYDQRVASGTGLRLLYMQVVSGGTLHPLPDMVRQAPAAERTGKLLLQSVDAALAERGESPPSESSLRRRLAATRWPEVVCWLGARMAAALDYAHGLGILHRDVKPANVLLTGEGSPKLADFNVSFSSKVEGATPAAYFGGSLAYMSPEQLEASNPNHERNAEELDGRSDLFSLAVMLWELLTGVRPFGDEHIEGTWTETLERLTERRLAGVPQKSIDALPRDLPSGMKEVLVGCLSPYAIDRPANGAVLARRLELCLQPRAQKLFRPSARSLATLARHWPLMSLVAIVVVVNVILSGFNIFFNFKAEIDKLKDLGHYDVVDVFKNEMLVVVNSVTYPVGTIVGLLLAWPVLRAVRLINEPRLNAADAPAAGPDARMRVSTLPDYLGWMTAALWFVSGFWFAAWIHHVIAAGGREAERNLYAHFVPTQILWGLVACTQIFFLMAALSVRAFWPALLDMGHPEPADAQRLWRLQQRAGWYFGLAISAPFIALLLVATSEETFRIGAAMLAGIGFFCSLLAWFLFRQLQRDVGALGAALEPKGDSIGGGEGTESFWTVSR